MLFDSWDSIGRMVIFGSAAYISAIVMLRISGSRTLSKMNAFDLVVTIAFGSTLSAIFVDASLALATGIAALALLVVLQYIVAATAVRWHRFSAMVTAQPVLLAWDGCFLDPAMRAQRVTAGDMHAAIRQRGLSGPEQVLAIVLEADGSSSVIGKSGLPGEPESSDASLPPPPGAS